MLRNIISVISMYTVLICLVFLFSRKIFDYVPVKNIIIANKYYIKDIVCIILSIIVVFMLFTANPPR